MKDDRHRPIAARRFRSEWFHFGRTPRRHARSRRGTTLVEVMLACLILAILAIAGGAYSYLSQSQIALARVKRVAMESARSRLETIRSIALTNYTGLAAWPSSQTANLTLLGKPVVLTTEKRYLTIGGGTGTAAAHDYLGFKVTVTYGSAFNKPNEAIVLDTFVGPRFQ
jgi:type II secretory pathway pseudopilin PulG